MNKDQIEDLINRLNDEEFTKANSIVKDLLADRISDRLDQEKISVADHIFNTDEDGDEEIADENLEDYLEDEDLEAIDDLENDYEESEE